MDISHPQAQWLLTYNDGRAAGPQKLSIGGKTVFSFMHCRIDGNSDDVLSSEKAHAYHRGGCALFEGSGVFSQGPAVELKQTHRIAANAMRITYDLKWPRESSLKNGIELGSLLLAGDWKRFFLVTSKDTAEAQWRDLPETGAQPISFSPLPVAIVLENALGQRIECGLGDDLWRWAQGLNGPYLHGVGRLELSRTGTHLAVRRWVTEVDPKVEAKLAAAADAKSAKIREQAAAKAAADQPAGAAAEAAKPAPATPVSQPEARTYRFNAYLAWSAPELVMDPKQYAGAKALAIDANGISRKDLSVLGPIPKVSLDLSKMPVDLNGRRGGKAEALPCWGGRAPQGLFRHIIRQLSEYAQEGTLVLSGGFTPGWCDTGSHENRNHPAKHWDLSALLDAAAWARQILGPKWVIAAPQQGMWAQLPSLSCLGVESGFRHIEE